MITKEFLQEVERLNSQPLSQEALKRLKEAKADTYPESLYLLQLARWGLENGVEPYNVGRQMVESLIFNWASISPQQAFDKLVLNEDGFPQLGVDSLGGDPEEAAFVLIDQIEAYVRGNPKLSPIG